MLILYLLSTDWFDKDAALVLNPHNFVMPTGLGVIRIESWGCLLCIIPVISWICPVIDAQKLHNTCNKHLYREIKRNKFLVLKGLVNS